MTRGPMKEHKWVLFIISNIRLYLFDQKCSKNSIVKCFQFTITSEINLICWFGAQEIFIIIINVDNY